MSTEQDEAWFGAVCVQRGEGLDPNVLEQLGAADAFVAEAARLALPPGDVGCTVRLVSESDIKSLNLQYRSRDSATNVLSFEQQMPAELAALLPVEGTVQSLGDIALCLDVARREADEQGKSLRDHVTHLVVHGVLHLRGFDHITDAEAESMEQLEVSLLSSRGIANPYHDDTRGQTPDSHG